MKTFMMPQHLVENLHSYLLARPMIEVEGLVLGLRQVQPMPIPDPLPDTGATAKPKARSRSGRKPKAAPAPDAAPDAQNADPAA
jgi:hypothetical protein